VYPGAFREGCSCDPALLTGGVGEDGETSAELFSFNTDLNDIFGIISRINIAKPRERLQNL
jgi:hypothetical protein